MFFLDFKNTFFSRALDVLPYSYFTVYVAQKKFDPTNVYLLDSFFHSTVCGYQVLKRLKVHCVLLFYGPRALH